jgi:glyoxylase-like metal-dependent hydrolase (beta-lactamase superfamily II)
MGSFRVANTPGHASHHLSYLHEPSGYAFTGDVAGVRIDDGCVVAPTPPPDIDLEAWSRSLQAIEAWRPRRLALTHFGSYGDVAAHLAALREELERTRTIPLDIEEAAFASATRARIAASTGPETAEAYEQAMPLASSFRGLMRYLQKRAS